MIISVFFNVFSDTTTRFSLTATKPYVISHHPMQWQNFTKLRRYKQHPNRNMARYHR
jgi:hypothetical protein